MMKTLMRSLHLATVAALLSACATPPPATVNHPAPPPPPPPVATVPPAPVAPPPAAPAVDTGASERALVAAIGAYDRGEFAAAIRQLNPMISDGSLDPAQLLRALKVLAFSQCSSGATTACRQSFEKAFRADPNFELLPAERGHPVWGPQFDRARRTVLGR